MATMKDVAARAGVSVGTVSYVLSGKAEEMRIPKETEKRVRDAAAELNYRADVSAKRLKKQSEALPTYTVVWNSDVNSDILERFMRGARDYREESGEKFEITVYPVSSEDFALGLESLGETYCNGAVFIGLSRENQRLADEATLPFPAVIFGETKNHSSVSTSEADAGRLAAEHFCACGVKKVVTVRKIYRMDDQNARLDAFYRRAKELGIECGELVSEYEYSMEGGITAACDVTELYPDADGIYYLVDIMAVGGMNYLLNRGLAGKIRLISHGNSVFSRSTYPGITSTAFPIEKMAKAALSILSGGKKEHVTLETEIFVRGSCRRRE